MLKTRVIPTLLRNAQGLVKGKSFDSWRRVGTVLPAIKVYNMREVDELILLDINATTENRNQIYSEIEELTSQSFVPLTIGGGINNLDQIKNLLLSGADKVCINTSAYYKPEIIKKASETFGSQCIIISVDVKKRKNGYLECYSHSGSKRTGKEVSKHCKEMQSFGAGEILITSITHDGMMKGYDLELITLISKSVTIPVIASGGAGNYKHMSSAIKSGANSVAAASMFHYTEQTPSEAKKYLKSNGIPIRNSIVT